MMKTLLAIALLAGAFAWSLARPDSTLAQAGSSAKAAKSPIDINTASNAGLRAIPGIGEAYAAAIVKGRPYKRKDELVGRKILPAGVYAKIEELIVAKQK